MRDVKEILDNVIENYIVLDKSSITICSDKIDLSEKESSKSKITEKIANALYSNFYVNGIDFVKKDIQSNIENKRNYSYAIDESFVNSLANSNHSFEGWEKGWILNEIYPDSSVLVKKNNLEMVFLINHYKAITKSYKILEKGDEVSVFRKKGEVGKSFYYVWGSIPMGINKHIVRFFFNCKSEKANFLVAFITKELNENRIPFSFKCFAGKDFFKHRVDNSVLYVESKYANRVYSIISKNALALQKIMNITTPLFTNKIFDGIGFGEDPNDNKNSFGTYRCYVISSLLFSAIQMKLSKNEFSAYIVDCLIKMGFDTDAFYLNANNKNIYSFNYER